jgi:hypothetical protein
MPSNPNTLRKLWKRVFRFLSSVKLAVILLMVLIVATAIGTIYESRFDAKVARAYVYDAPWFNVWLLILGVNLAAAAFSRYPWKKHHTGFVITHAGIITLLVGAVVGRVYGIEGTMTIFKGHEPSNRLVIDQQEVRIQNGDHIDTFPIGIQHRRPHPDKPTYLGTTADGWKIDVTDYADMLLPVSVALPVTDKGAPALQVKLWSMGQNINEWLWPNDPDNCKIDLGLLAVECRLGSAVTPALKRGAASNSAPSYLEKVSTTATTPAAAAATADPALPPGDRAIIYLADDGKLSYYVQNKEGVIGRGDLEAGKAISTGWGSWQMEVTQVMPQAVPSTDFHPIAKGTKMAPRDRANLTDGIKVQFSRGDEHDEEWLASGWSVDLPGENETLSATFGSKILQMPISLELKQFDVERNEGNDSPAGFKSTIMVRDAEGNTAVGSCSMNEPMNFPDALWRSWTGLTYKISQASWNPDNLQQSSVQILLDPGWLFKWTGSLMVCLGIFTMFYLRPPRDAAHP